MPKPGNPLMAGRGPYAVALVDLAEGVRVFTEIVGVEPESVTVGQAVRLTWEPLTDGRNLPLFRPEPPEHSRPVSRIPSSTWHNGLPLLRLRRGRVLRSSIELQGR